MQGAENFRTAGVHLTVSRASQAAIDAIEAQQGTLVARYENRLTLVSNGHPPRIHPTPSSVPDAPR